MKKLSLRVGISLLAAALTCALLSPEAAWAG
jgi:hypothetical protein